MLYYATKVILSALIIVVVSEVAKYSAGLGALIKSLPLISILAIIWLGQRDARGAHWQTGFPVEHGAERSAAHA